MAIAMQQPVDLDYKAMANVAAWGFVGLLPTQRHKQRGARRLRPPPATSTLLPRQGRTATSSGSPVQSAHREDRAVLDPLGDVVPAWAADEGADRDADRRTNRRAVGRECRRPESPALAEDESEVAPEVAEGVPALPGPGGAVGVRSGEAGGSEAAAAVLAARVSLRFDDTAAGVDVTEEWEALDGPYRGRASTSTTETAVDFDERDFGVGRLRYAAAYVLPARRSTTRCSSVTPPSRSSAVCRHEDARALPDPQAPPLRPARGDSRGRSQARADEAAKAGDEEATRRSATRRRRSATGSTGPSRLLGVAPRRRTSSSARARGTELLSGVGSVPRGAAGRQGRLAHDRPRRPGTGGAATRRGMTTPRR